MTIKDVEDLTGITRQNIRYYERENLISPRRNPENQYREYSSADVKALNRIRLYRKLGVSIEDIRRLNDQSLSLENCMEQCISSMEKEMARMAKMKEVCEEVRKLGEEGLAPAVERTLEQIDAFEKSGYQFADISKDYWDQKVVAEIRGGNRQVGKALFWSLEALILFTILCMALPIPRWLQFLPAGLIGYDIAWFLWGRRNAASVKKHVRFAKVPLAVYPAAAAVGILLYPMILGSIVLTSNYLPDSLRALSTWPSGVFTWLAMLQIPQNVFYAGIFCVLLYDTYRQKSVISALCLSSLLFALSASNLLAAPGYLFAGICLGLLYELTSSAAASLTAFFFQAVSAAAAVWLEFLLPGILPEYLVTEQTMGQSALIPWTMLSFVLILLLLFLTGRLSKRKIDWKLEWEKERSFSAASRISGEEATIMDQEAYHEIEKERRRSYRLFDFSLAAAILFALCRMTGLL